jgi:hypothetical protein
MWTTAALSLKLTALRSGRLLFTGREMFTAKP